MKKILSTITIIVLLAALLFYRTNIREREIVILSTNDIHANIGLFPQLVTAVECCRDSVATLLVDAGDRWTGNVYIDLAEGRLPIIDLMNEVGYDAATLGNHEFDKGAALLQGAIERANFPILCANMQSNREDMATPEAATIITAKNGIKVAVAGVVTNFDGGHPEGSNEVYEGLVFSHPFEAAEDAFGSSKGGDIRLLLSHMGDDKDVEFATTTECCDIIIGGHTHNVVDTVVNNIVIGQTGRKLKHIGATKIRMKGRNILSVEYQNIPLAGYAQDSATLAKVAQIESNPQLKVPVGTLLGDITHTGFANMLTKALVQATDTQIGFYHYGGIRLANHPAGEIELATIYNLEPFESKMHTITMTPAQMRTMIIAKFNDTVNAKESHRVDLFCSTPYQIVVDSRGEAVDIIFPKLQKGHKYSVVMSDYIGKKYPSIEGENHTAQNILVTDALLELLKKQSVTPVDNKSYQIITKR